MTGPVLLTVSGVTKRFGGLVAVDVEHLEIDASETLAALRRGPGAWEKDVPEGVAQRIIEGRLLGYDSE